MELRKAAQKLALCGMLTALAVVCLLLGGLIPIALYCCPILAMLCLLPVREEYGAGAALAVYAAAAVLAVLLVADKELAFVYVFFGWYPAAQPRLDQIRLRALRTALMLLLLNGAGAALYALLIFVLRLDGVTQELSGSAPWFLALLLVMGNIIFLLTDPMLRRMALLWWHRLRRRLFRRS